MRLPKWGVARRLRPIRLVAMDCDGVLTDGGLWYAASGEVAKRFHVHDGLGIHRLHEAGILTAVLTGGPGFEAVKARARGLGISVVVETHDKLGAMEDLLGRLGLGFAQTAFIGDDLQDIPLMRRVGLPIAVANARPEVRRAACYVTRARGGHGALREVADMIGGRGRWPIS